MLFTALALMLASQPTHVADDGKTIIVTARSLADTEAALKACLARHCPPEEDIEASAAHAENLFVAGRYDDSIVTLNGSIGRNARYSPRLPVQVSGLYRAHSRVAAHLGRSEQYRSSSYSMVRSLKAGLPEKDARVIAARFELAGSQLSLGRPRLARDTYQDVAHDAESIGRGDLARLARLRVAWIDYLQGDQTGSRARLRKMAADPSPDARVSRIAALVLLSRIDRAEGRKDGTDTLIDSLRQAGLSKPVLLYSPPMELKRSPIQDEHEVGSTLRLMPMDTFEKKWVDVGFWVESDGSVRDVEILRNSGVTDWTAPLMASIKGRIYAPMADAGGSYRVERHTYTSRWTQISGTRIKQRSPDARIEMLDLSTD